MKQFYSEKLFSKIKIIGKSLSQFLGLGLLLAVLPMKAQINVPTLPLSYTQNFNTLATSGTGNTWTNNTTLSGWFLFRQPASGPVAIIAYDASTGTSTTGSFYSFGTSISDTERALGGVGSGATYFGSPAAGAVAGWIAVAFTNSTGSTINTITIGFDGEQWRNGGNTSAQTMVLEYGIGASFGAVGTWTAPGGTFDWTSPVTGSTGAAVNGNIAGLVSGRGGTLTGLNWTNGTTLWIRWIELNDTGNDHGLAIDNFSLSISAPPCAITAITVSNISDCNGQNTHNTSDDTFTADVTVTFTNPPGTGNLVLSGDGSATVLVGSLGSSTSHTFTGVTMSADGGAIALTATFSADMACTFTNSNAGMAPASCSPTCTDGIQNGDETGVDCGGANCPACPPPTSCTITSIALSNVSTCNNNSTVSPADDFFTADVTVTFTNPPGTGNLVLTGDGSATVPVGSLGSSTSHTFIGVTMSADGGAIALTATFSEDTPCTFTNSNADTAPASCSAILCSDPVGSIANNGPVCEGEDVFLTFTATSGTAPFSIVVNNLNSGNPITGLPGNGAPFWTLVAPPAGSTSYVLESITDANGCVVMNLNDSTTVVVNPLPAGKIANSGPVCEGEDVFLTFTATSGTAPFSIVVNNLNSGNPITGLPGNGAPFWTLVEPPAGSTPYVLESITDDNGCVVMNLNDSTTVVVNPLPALSGSVNGVAFDNDPDTEVPNEVSVLICDGEAPVFTEMLMPNNSCVYVQPVIDNIDTNVNGGIWELNNNYIAGAGNLSFLFTPIDGGGNGDFLKLLDPKVPGSVTWTLTPLTRDGACAGSEPVDGDCLGDPVVVTVRVNPIPTLSGTVEGVAFDNDPDTEVPNKVIVTICSDEAPIFTEMLMPNNSCVYVRPEIDNIDTDVNGGIWELNNDYIAGAGNLVFLFTPTSGGGNGDFLKLLDDTREGRVTWVLTPLYRDGACEGLEPNADDCLGEPVSVTVRVLPCKLTISMDDPCSCKNNATTLENGQFDEFIEVIAPSGRTWTLTAVSGFFNVASPAPPAAPIDNLLGANFIETPNSDGTSTYRIEGIHVDGVGFSITATNDRGISRSIGNTCYYPNPEITGLDDAYCEDDKRRILLTGTIDRGDGTPAAAPDAQLFAIFNGMTPVFDPAVALHPRTLGPGVFTVRYTVDAANEGISEVAPNVFVGFPGCIQSVTRDVRIDPQIIVDAGTPQSVCQSKSLALSTLNPNVTYSGNTNELVYSWSIVESGDNGVLSGTSTSNPTQGIYTPGPDAIARGYVTLRLTVDNPNDACGPASDTVIVTILKVGCGEFPWDGRN